MKKLLSYLIIPFTLITALFAIQSESNLYSQFTDGKRVYYFETHGTDNITIETSTVGSFTIGRIRQSDINKTARVSFSIEGGDIRLWHLGTGSVNPTQSLGVRLNGGGTHTQLHHILGLENIKNARMISVVDGASATINVQYESIKTLK